MPSSNSNSNKLQKQDPAQEDAQMVKHWYSLNWLFKLLLVLILLLVIVCISLAYMLGTSGGTKFIIEKIINETGVYLKYGEGNFRDGLWINDINIPSNNDLNIEINEAYIKIGWRAIFKQEIHLRDAEIDSLYIKDNHVSTGKPFSYSDINLPVHLHLDHAKVRRISYENIESSPLIFKDIEVDDIRWINTELDIGNADLTFSYLKNLEDRDIVRLENTQGTIDFHNDYPINAKTKITLFDITKHYFDDINLKATGSLKSLHGKLDTKYNDSRLLADVDIEPLAKDAPFTAHVTSRLTPIPYASNYDIKLRNPKLDIKGTWKKMIFDIDSDLTARHVPSGHYQGHATLITKEGQMSIDKLRNTSKKGDLTAYGILNWDKNFWMEVQARSSNYQLDQILPTEYKDYRGYLPEHLNGTLNFKYQQKNTNGKLQIDTTLKQKNAEKITAKIIQIDELNNPKQSNPYSITANWTNLYRKINPKLDVHSLGIIDSPEGSAKIFAKGNHLKVDLVSDINQISAAPKGNYKVNLDLINNKLNIKDINYQGAIGDLTGSANVIFPNSSEKNKPLIWSLVAHTERLNPNAYNQNIPISAIKGDFLITDTMYFGQTSKQNKKNSKSKKQTNVQTEDSQLHQIVIDRANLNITTLDNREVLLSGNSKFDLGLDKDVNVTNFAIQYDGNLTTTDLPKGQYSIIAKGNPKDINLDKLLYTGNNGKLLSTGTVTLKSITNNSKSLGESISWKLNSDLTQFDLSFFQENIPAILTGKLNTNGSWFSSTPNQANKSNSVTDTKASNKTKPINQNQTGELQNFSVTFDGDLKTESLPTGSLAINASLNNKDGIKNIELKTLSHNSPSGSINASGSISLPTNSEGYKWQFNSKMQDFNFEYLNSDLPSQLTGEFTTAGHWSKDYQNIEIGKIDIHGKLKNQELETKGQLLAKLNLPNNMTDFLDSLKNSSTDDQYKKARDIINDLEISGLNAKWGNNTLIANGDINSLEAKVNIANLDQLNKDLVGQLTGQILIIDNSKNQKQNALPSININLTAKEIAFPKIKLNNGSVQAEINNLGNNPSHIAINASELISGTNKIKDVSLDFNGTQKKHNFNISFNNDQAILSSKFSGGLNTNNQWKGVLSQSYIDSENISLKQIQPSSLYLDLDNLELHLDAHCWQANKKDGRFCLNNKLVLSQNKGAINFKIQALDSRLLSFAFPEDLNLRAKVNGNAQVQWQKGTKPRIKAVIYSDNGRIGMKQEDNTHIFMPYRRISVIALSTKNGLRLRTDINSDGKGKGFAEITVNPYNKNKPIQGNLSLHELNLAIFKPFFPGMRLLGGNGTLNANINGTLKKPLINGNFNLKNGYMSMLGLPLSLSKVNATANINNTQAKINGSFYSGKGKGSLSGIVDWKSTLQAKLSIIGKQLDISEPPLLAAKINPDINVIIKPSDKYLEVKGAISIPTATIRPPEASADIITKSEDITVLDRQQTDNIDDVFAITTPWSINADIGIDLGNDIIFKGFGAELPLVGALLIRQRGQSKMTGKGVIQVSRRSTIEAFGQNVELEHAQIRFNGDIQKPNLSIAAVKNIDNSKVGFKVKGNIENPEITVFNDIGLSEQQAMNALVTGRLNNTSTNQVSAEGFRSEVTNNLAAAGLSLGLDSTRSITNQIGRAVGLQSLTLSASGNSNDTHINVTGYITPDLYIRYAFGVFSAQSQLSARYQLTQRFYFEATSATEKFIDLVYSWKF